MLFTNICQAMTQVQDEVESFNPLWGQWPQWSELYQPYVTQLEDNLVSNLHRVAFGHKFKPNKQWEIIYRLSSALGRRKHL